MSFWEYVIAIVGLAAITVLTRGLFMIPERDLKMPGWVQRGLRYSPLAALMAVLAPEIVMTQGHLIDTFKDARLISAAIAIAWYFGTRQLIGCIVVGLIVFLPLHIGLGW